MNIPWINFDELDLLQANDDSEHSESRTESNKFDDLEEEGLYEQKNSQLQQKVDINLIVLLSQYKRLRRS